MAKYFLKQSKKEVKVGDTIELIQPVETPFGRVEAKKEVPITEENLSKLIELGYVEVKEDEGDALHPYVRMVARQIGAPFFGAAAFLQVISDVTTLATFNILLFQISKKLNRGKDLKRYSKLWVIGCTGKITQVENINLNLEYLPVFTSKEDAQKALGILPELHSFLYGEQENH